MWILNSKFSQTIKLSMLIIGHLKETNNKIFNAGLMYFQTFFKPSTNVRLVSKVFNKQFADVVDGIFCTRCCWHEEDVFIGHLIHSDRLLIIKASACEIWPKATIKRRTTSSVWPGICSASRTYSWYAVSLLEPGSLSM